MSNSVVAFNPAQLPAFAKKGELSALAKALMGGGGQSGKRVSIKGGVFRLISDGKEIASIEERYLDVVIVNAAPHIGRTYYAGVYDPENPAPPECWSADGEKPSEDSANKQCDTCANCPQNVKGSGQGESRACRFSQRLAVVLANDMGGDVLQLSVPAASIFGEEEGDNNRPLKAYARWLGAQGVDPDTLVTRMKFDTKAESAKLFFRAMRWLSAEEYAQCQEQGKTPAAVQAVTFTVAKMDKVEKFESKPLALEGTPPKAAKKSEPKEEPKDDGDEPVVREEKKAPAVTPKQKLAATVTDWDTDD